MSINTDANFTKQDIKDLHFNDYESMRNAVIANPDSVVSKNLVANFGDPSEWNKAFIENSLGVKGKYRSFGGGDLSDIYNSLLYRAKGNDLMKYPAPSAQPVDEALAKWLNKQNTYYGNYLNPYYTKDDMRALKFNDYNSMRLAVKQAPNNNFSLAMKAAFGDPEGWDLHTVESILKAKGKYRSFGNGDYGDIYNNLNDRLKYNTDFFTQNTYNRGEVRRRLRNMGLNPYDYTGEERRALRWYLNGDTRGLHYDKNILRNSKLNDQFGFEFYKEGGKMNDLLQQIINLVLAAAQGDLQATQQIQQIVEAAKQGDLQALQIAQMILQVIQQMQGVQSAKHGSKLDYINYLRGKCPEGYELEYYKRGGTICKRCKQKRNSEDGSPVEQFKQGHKTKKGSSGIKFA